MYHSIIQNHPSASVETYMWHVIRNMHEMSDTARASHDHGNDMHVMCDHAAASQGIIKNMPVTFEENVFFKEENIWMIPDKFVKARSQLTPPPPW